VDNSNNEKRGNYMKNVYLIIGPSGSGKTSIANELQDVYGFKTVESYTTRPPRYKGERGHIFVTDEEFDKLGEMVAYTEYNGYRYGVTAEIIDANDIYVIDPPGVKHMRKHYHGRKGIVTIGLEVSETIRALRMMNRGDPLSDILKRLEIDAQWFGNERNKIVYNAVCSELGLNVAVDYIKKYIEIKEGWENLAPMGEKAREGETK
jgi:guanylate kinase